MYDTNKITTYMGIGFIVLGSTFYLGKVNLDQFTIFTFSIAAFFFIISDFIDFQMKVKDNKRKYKKSSFLTLIKNAFFMLAVLSIIFVPYIKNNINESLIHTLSNTAILIGLGVSIFLTGLRSQKEAKIFMEKALTVEEKTVVLSEKPIKSAGNKSDRVEIKKREDRHIIDVKSETKVQ